VMLIWSFAIALILVNSVDAVNKSVNSFFIGIIFLPFKDGLKLVVT
jgi:hypothetical protein